MTSALRSFLHEIALDLAAPVPVVANWSMTPIPRAIAPDQVHQLLRSIDRSHAQGAAAELRARICTPSCPKCCAPPASRFAERRDFEPHIEFIRKLGYIRAWLYTPPKRDDRPQPNLYQSTSVRRLVQFERRV